MRLLLLFPLLVLAPPPHEAVTLPVCPGSSPFTAAQRQLRALRVGGHRGPVVLELCDTSSHDPIVLGALDSGTDARGLTVVRGVGAAAFDPGVVVTGWVKKGSVWQAPLPAGMHASRNLWVNGVRAARAHANPASCSGGITPGPDPCHSLLSGHAVITPTGYANVTSPLPNFTVAGGKPGLEHWLLPGSEFVFGKGSSGASWTEPRCPVATVRPSVLVGTVDIEMAMPCWARATGKSEPAAWDTGQSVLFPSDIENAPALLSEPGEWHVACARHMSVPMGWFLN